MLGKCVVETDRRFGEMPNWRLVVSPIRSKPLSTALIVNPFFSVTLLASPGVMGVTFVFTYGMGGSKWDYPEKKG